MSKSKGKGNKKTYGISLNDANAEDAALMRELEARGNASVTLRAALKLLLWGETTEIPAPPEHPLAELVRAMIAKQEEMITEQQEARKAIQAIQIVQSVAPSTNGNGHRKKKPANDERESLDDPLVAKMTGMNFATAKW